MSCNRNSLRCKAASVASGISTLGSQAGNVVGVLNTKADQALQQLDMAGFAQADLAKDRLGSKFAEKLRTTATAVNSQETRRAIGILGSTTATVVTVASQVAPTQTKVAARSIGKVARTVATSVGPTAVASSEAAMGAVLGLPSRNGKTGFLKFATAQIAGKAIPPLATARLAVQAVNLVTSTVGSAAGELSKTKEAGEVTQERKKLFGFKSQQKTALWCSKLTDHINSRDVMLSAKNITRSKGAMFKANGNTWHSGTVEIKMPASGKKRTITHLQSMSMPASHYYFNRPVSGEQAVGIATGKVKPQNIPSFRGQVSQIESLVKPVADAKHSLIKAGLHWPPNKN